MSDRMRYVFTQAEYGVIQGYFAALMQDHPEKTLAALADHLGSEEAADRFLEKLQLIGLMAEMELAEKEASTRDAEPSQR